MIEVSKTPLRPTLYPVDHGEDVEGEIWLCADHSEAGAVSFAAVRSGCGEADELVPDYAAFATDLCKSWNCHDDLVGIAQTLIEWCERTDAEDGDDFLNGDADDGRDGGTEMLALIERARAALAKARPND